MTKGAKKLYLVTLALTYCAEVEARSEEEAMALAAQDAERQIRLGDNEDEFDVDVDNTSVEEAEDVSEEYGDLDEESQEQSDVENALTESGIRSLDDQASVALGEVLKSGLADLDEVQAELAALARGVN